MYRQGERESLEAMCCRNTRSPDRADHPCRSDVKWQLKGGVLRALVDRSRG
jgi:hypothetical protein